jgi:hypothetical protein
MFGSAPKFPAFETWKRMSENEQDAFLARLEKTRRYRSIIIWTLAGLLVTFVSTTIVLHTRPMGWR